MEASKTKSVILAIAIALISLFFFVYAIQIVYPEVKYNNFCNNSVHAMPSNNKVDCLSAGGKWISYQKGNSNVKASGYCDSNYYCMKNYETARKSYDRNVFFTSLVVGVIVFVGAFFLALESVSAGLMGGAIMLIFYGTVRYWGELSDIWRTLMLGIVLVVLIWLGYKKLNK